MKQDIAKEKIGDSVFLLQPSKPILCTTKNEDNTDHVAPFSWLIPVSNKPPRVGLALLNTPNKQHTLINIEREGEFVINVPDINIIDKLVEASYFLLENTNKFDRSGFTRLVSKVVTPPSIMECRAHLECKVLNIIKTGDHSLVIGDVVWARFDDQAFTPDLLIKLENFTPVIHLKNYKMEDYQAHVFLSPSESRIIEVEYPKKDK